MVYSVLLVRVVKKEPWSCLGGEGASAMLYKKISDLIHSGSKPGTVGAPNLLLVVTFLLSSSQRLCPVNCLRSLPLGKAGGL